MTSFELTNFAQFSKGRDVYVHRKATGGYFERQIILHRALSLVGKKYDLLTFNCEHAANLAQVGKAESPQVRGFVVIALALIGLAFVAREG